MGFECCDCVNFSHLAFLSKSSEAQPISLVARAFHSQASATPSGELSASYTRKEPTISYIHNMGVNPKIVGETPKMDGENKGSNPIKIPWIWGGKNQPLFLVQHPHMILGCSS